MDGNALTNFFKQLITTFANIGNWLFSPLVFNLSWTTPIILVSATGLITFLTIAIIKWGLS